MFRYCILIIVIVGANYLFSETGYKFRGFVESTGRLNLSLDNTDPNSINREFNQGFFTLSNQYIKIKPESGMTIVASINQTILSGVSTEEYERIQDSSPGFYNVYDYYILGLDIERLYFNYRINRVKVALGLQRLSRGFNFAFTPFDFLGNEGKLSLVTEYETTDFSSLALYFIPSEDPMEKEIWSSTSGILYKLYGGFVDFQAQYNLFFPKVYDGDFNHLLGVAFKGDFIVGLSSEITYRLNEECLDLSIGLDYTFYFDKELHIMCEYFFNGAGLSSGSDWQLGSTELYLFRHYFYGSLDLTVTDDLNMKLSGIYSPETLSGIGMYECNVRVSDSSTFTCEINVPMDKNAWDIDDIDIKDIGEYGPLRVGDELELSFIYKIRY